VFVVDQADKNRTRSVCPRAWFSPMRTIKGNVRNKIKGTTLLSQSCTLSFYPKFRFIQAVIGLANNGNAEFLFNGFTINHKRS